MTSPNVRPRSGRELEPAFRYCPYRYYERLSAFRRALCQDSWERWYREQWANARVLDKALQAYNNISQGTYRILYAWDHRYDNDLALVGFKNLDRIQVLDWLNAVNSVSSSSSNQAASTAIQSLLSIDSTALREWLNTLADAAQAGNFDEIYTQLLQSDGMDKLQQALIQLLPSGNSKDVEQILRSAALQVASGEDPLIALIRHEIIAFLTRFNTPNIAQGDAERMAQAFVESLQAVIAQLQGTELFFLLSQRPGWADFLAQLGLPIGGDPEDVFKKLMHVLIQHIFYNSGNSVLGRPGDPCSAACSVVTRDLRAFLQWINLHPNRVNVGFGTLMTAFSATRTGWQIKGIWGATRNARNIPLSPTDQQVFLMGFLPKDKSPSGRSIVVAVRGDSCQECGTRQNIDDILKWAKGVLDTRTIWNPGGLFGIGRGFTFNADRGAMVLAFTRPGATGVDDVIRALQGDPRLANSAVPIIVAWLSADGSTVYYACVGSGCGNLSDEEQKRIACDWVLGSSTCNAQPQEGTTSTSEESQGQGEAVVTMAPPPPPAPGSICGWQICLMQVKQAMMAR